ncbi:MAG: protein kinase domain-containing protein [Planctomycetota bacterium]
MSFSGGDVPDGNTVIMPPGQVPGAASSAGLAAIAPETFVGKYRIRRLLGQGGMGTVYLAFDPLIEREVAIKLLSPELSSNADSLRRFLGEARSIGRLNHPNVVAIHAIDVWDGRYYLVMELLTGGSVADLAEKRGRLPIRQAASFLAQAARGLAAAHQAGMVHRDIKPANLMLNRDGVVKVVDFGLSRVLDAVATGPDQATRAGQIVGTPHFMSPEQFEGGAVDARSDIYSLGASFFRLITGEFPFQRCSTIVQLMKAHMLDAPPAATAVDPALPPLADQIIHRCMAKRPEDRFQSATEVADALEQFATHDSVAGSGSAAGFPSELSGVAMAGEPSSRTLSSLVAAERSALQARMLKTACKTFQVSGVQVFPRIDEADAVVDGVHPEVIWTAMELDDARGIDWLRRLGRKGRTATSAVVLHSSDSTISELLQASTAPCRLLAPKTLPADQILRLLHAAGPAQLAALQTPSELHSQRSIRILSDTERLPEQLKSVIRELALVNLHVAGMLDAAVDTIPAELSLIIRTAEIFAGDEAVYAGLVTNRRDEILAAVQHSGKGLFLRAVGKRGGVAVVNRPFDAGTLRSLLESIA